MLLLGMLAAPEEGDEDMKIAADHFSAPREDAFDAEAAAKAYLRQKSLGNVDKARALGQRFAATLAESAGDLYREDLKDTPMLIKAHHRVVLFSYTVNKVIADLSPNSILAQTTLNVFYDELETNASELASHIRDMAAFSLYMLCDRSDGNTPEAIGRVYAQLCGEEDNPRLALEGSNLYHQYYQACAALCGQTEYARD